MRCPRCGAVLRDDAEQCGFCGEKIVPAVSFEKPIIENRPRDEAFDVENTVQPEVPQQQQNHDQNPIVIAIIILSGVLMAAVGVLLFYAFKNSQRAIINVNTTSTEEASQPSTTPPATVPDPSEKADGGSAQGAGETEPAAEEAESHEAAAEESAGESGAVIQTVSYDDRENEGIIYRFSGNQAIVLKCQSEEEWVEIPDSIDGVPVIGISEDAFNGCAHLKYIDLPEGVAWIGARAFMNCTNLREIVMPDTLVTIGNETFNYCPLFTIVSHETAYGQTYAEYHNLNWLEGESLVPID